MPVEGLDQPCGTCGRRSGDHTLDEWAKCMGRTEYLPLEDIPADAARVANEALRRQLDLDDDLLIADHVVVKAVGMDAHSGPVGIKMPGLIHEFAVGVSGQPPATICRILFLGDVDSVRNYGRLVRDSANRAVKAVGGTK